MRIQDCVTGTALPELALPLDRSTIVATAIASQDFEDVHHDPAAAGQRGAPDIFLSINATNGFLDRYVTDTFGPRIRITRVSMRLGVPNFPGDTMTLSGEVTGAGPTGVTLRVMGRNTRGTHVRADVTIAPGQEGAR